MARMLRIGLRMGSADPFWVQLREAIYQKAQDLAVALVSVDAARPPAQLSTEEQISLVEELLAQELDALISTYLPDSLAYRLLDAGIPVIHLTETEVRHPHFVSPLWFYDIAQIVGAYLARQLLGHGRVLVVGGLLAQQGEDGKSRIAGIHDALRPYPQMQITHIPSLWRYERAYPQIVAGMRQLGPPLDAIFGLSDSLALAARDAAHTLGLLDRNTLIVGINGDPLALAAIANGSMAATVETSASDFGCQAVELACRAARGQRLPTHFSARPHLVTVENVAELAIQKLVGIAELPSRLVGVNRQREQQRMTQLEVGLAINRRVGTILDRQQLAHEIANLICSNYGYDRVQIWLWREQSSCWCWSSPRRSRSVDYRYRWPGRACLGRRCGATSCCLSPIPRAATVLRPTPAGRMCARAWWCRSG